MQRRLGNGEGELDVRESKPFLRATADSSYDLLFAAESSLDEDSRHSSTTCINLRQIVRMIYSF